MTKSNSGDESPFKSNNETFYRFVIPKKPRLGHKDFSYLKYKFLCAKQYTDYILNVSINMIIKI